MKDLPPDGALSFRTSLAMIILASVAVTLRFYSRLNTRQGIAIEDVVMAVALCFFWTDQGIFLTGLLEPGTSGSSNIDWSEAQAAFPFLKMIYIEEVFFITTITTVKISILLFYRRIFATARFRALTTAFGLLCLLWWFIAFFVIVFQCYPVEDFWNYQLQLAWQASCLAPGTVIFGIEITNLFIDIMILCLPLWMINSLQMSTHRKISVGSMFLLGGFVCMTSCVRSYYIFEPSTGAPRDVGTSLDWSTAELATAIVCGCLPTYGPLLQMTNPFTGQVAKWYSSRTGSNWKFSQKPDHGSKPKYPLTSYPSNQAVTARYEEIDSQSELAGNAYTETGQKHQPNPAEIG